jgi:hypothetical protein
VASVTFDEAERAILVTAGVPFGALDDTLTVTAAPPPVAAAGNVIDCAVTPALVSPGICAVVDELVDGVTVTLALELAAATVGEAVGVAVGEGLGVVDVPPHATRAVATTIAAPHAYFLMHRALHASSTEPPNRGLTRKRSVIGVDGKPSACRVNAS